MKTWIGLLLLIVTLPLRAGDLIDQLSDRAAGLVSIKGQFKVQRQIAVLPLPLESEGHFEYSKDNGIYWETLIPIASALHITENGVSVDGVQRHQLGVGQFAQALLDIFSGDIEGLEDNFSISAVGHLKQWEIILKPNNSGVTARLVAIRIFGSDNIESIQILEANQDCMTIDLVTESTATETVLSEGSLN